LVWFCQGGRFHQSRLDSLGFSPPESPPAPWPPWPSGWIRWIRRIILQDRVLASFLLP
jgi:hypothetical protein